MVYAKKKKSIKTAKKSSTRSRASAPKRASTLNKSIVNMGLGFPKMLKMVHKYSDQYNYSATTGVRFAANFSCNGLFDPYLSGPGHQPMYFDQLTALYDHYCVIGAKIVVHITPTSATIVPGVVGVFINDDTTTTPTDVNTCMEQSLTRFKFVNNQSLPVTFSMNWSAKKIFGATVLSNTELQGTSIANPTEASAFTIWGGALDTTTTQTYSLQVNITYITVWKELRDIAGS